MSALLGRAAVRVTLLCAVALLAAPATTSAVAKPKAKTRAVPVSSDLFGINAGGLMAGSQDVRDRSFAAMRAGGLTYVRSDASWNGVEPEAPVEGVRQYQWAALDARVADLAEHGLRWYPMIGYSAPWAASVPGDLFSPPSSDVDFASYAAAVARRYGPGGEFWFEHPEVPAQPVTTFEIWNEPNSRQFWRGPTATPRRYIDLYVAARQAIHAVIPGARVVTGGLLDAGGNAGGWFRQMVRSRPGAKRLIDAVGWHPYTGAADDQIKTLTRARENLRKLGLRRTPIEVTEAGWTGVDAQLRGKELRRLTARLPRAGLRVTRLIPYAWDGGEDWTIANPDGTPGLAGNAYLGTVTRLLKGVVK